MDASTLHSGAVISKDDKPIAFYSRKLNSAQVHHTIMHWAFVIVHSTNSKRVQKYTISTTN